MSFQGLLSYWNIFQGFSSTEAGPKQILAQKIAPRKSRVTVAQALTKAQIYEGELNQDMVREGFGRYCDNTGKPRYVGYWSEDLPHGIGHFMVNLRFEYIGSIAYGVFHGVGIQRWNTLAGVAEFRGEFCHGKRHGSGVSILPDGRKLKSTWNMGDFVSFDSE